MVERPHYLLPPSALGYYRRIPVDHIVSATVFSHYSPTEEESLIPVVLYGDPSTDAWRVRWQYGILGEIGADIREEYRDVDRVLGSGFMPETIAGISLGEDGTPEVDVFLPPPELTVPRNNVSSDVLVLPPGEAIYIDTTLGDFEDHDLALASPGQWFVVLIEMVGEPVALIDGRVVGAFDHDARDTVLRYMRAAKEEDPTAPVAARGYAIESSIALDIGYPQGDAEHVPPLTLPDPRPRDIMSVTDYSDGTYSINVAWFAATDPVDSVAADDTSRRVPTISNHDYGAVAGDSLSKESLETAVMDMREVEVAERSEEPVLHAELAGAEPADAEPGGADLGDELAAELGVELGADFTQAYSLPSFSEDTRLERLPAQVKKIEETVQPEAKPQSRPLTQRELVQARRAERAWRLEQGLPLHTDLDELDQVRYRHPKG
ncbi:hypothetical protein [Corynebacterium cystitidis]|uniref:Uncharacterized protein n=1 Tax=Corynebacterium cystitidis DSM 20524 TaxID=1121357 RepID=A0A1H9VI41_9CORY|nr:hypothetical protein [Corynebacterium cystitidis]WJY81392.1 hypothetical protein CCYS_02095 [Corynebacterium cystitidis DSM 20524]SES20907.1 hypothetical protein SAMN05661109_02232 [Corynebacterium cystitidis DSM 20524]SNV87875.1 Uncharacterised protein [Corynebacterium cystitidis]